MSCLMSFRERIIFAGMQDFFQIAIYGVLFSIGLLHVSVLYCNLESTLVTFYWAIMALNKITGVTFTMVAFYLISLSLI